MKTRRKPDAKWQLTHDVGRLRGRIYFDAQSLDDAKTYVEQYARRDMLEGGSHTYELMREGHAVTFDPHAWTWSDAQQSA